ncbi:APC family permease [Nocardioides terrisoli]|uniref:APC family permease n=1 Tax=Nocardioides terrisoli TaxID=3388267 RepID=UPI00287B977F|nr:APC family permease [Nocardioides marmorisolisilvae]
MTTRTTEAADEPRLRRHIGVTGLLFASVGSIIGSGWLFGALNSAKQAGPAAMISWALGGVMILLIALVYAELGTMFPLSGGVVRYPHMSFGSFASYTTGWITWVAVATTAPIEVEGALQYATKYAPFTHTHCVAACGTKQPVDVHTLTALGYVTAVVLMAVFVVVNYFGIRWFARINNVLVGWKLFMITLVVIAFLATAFHAHNFTQLGYRPYGWHGVFSAIATGGIVFSYLGFRQGIELAGETDNPRRNVPLAVIGSVLITGVLYVLLQVAFIAALDPSILTKAGAWGSLSYGGDFGPLASLATLLGLGWLAVLLYIDAIISPGDTGLIYTTITSRISYAMARNGNAPRALQRTTDRGVPLVSLVVTFVVGLVVFLPFPSWQQLVGFITSATVMSFASGPLVLSALRKQQPDQERPFRLPGGHIIPVLAFWASNMIVYWSGWDVVWKLMVAVLLGFLLLGAFMLSGQVRLPDLELPSGAAWIVPWLGGVTLISWLGSFPEPAAGNRMELGFGTSAGIMLVLSVVVYVLAHRFRLSPEQAARHIAETEKEAAVTDEQLAD